MVNSIEHNFFFLILKKKCFYLVDKIKKIMHFKTNQDLPF